MNLSPVEKLRITERMVIVDTDGCISSLKHIRLLHTTWDTRQDSIILYWSHRSSAMSLIDFWSHYCWRVTYKTPLKLTETRAFLGLSGYYRRFVKDYFLIAKPLYALTEKDVEFEWTEECQRAFDELKQCLMNGPILALPRDEGQYICLLYTSPSPRD